MSAQDASVGGSPSRESSMLGDSQANLSPMDILRAWKLRKSQCKHRVQRDCCVLSPMDEMLWFNSPVMNRFSSAQTNVTFQCAQANPMRVGIIFSVFSGGSFIINIVDPQNPANGTIQGITITQAMLPFMITQADWGPLVQSAWFAVSTGAIPPNLAVFEITLKDWPQMEG